MKPPEVGFQKALGKMLRWKVWRRHISGVGRVSCSILPLAVIWGVLWPSFDWSMEFGVISDGCTQHIRSVPALSNEVGAGILLWSRNIVVRNLRADSAMFSGGVLAGVAVLLAADQFRQVQRDFGFTSGLCYLSRTLGLLQGFQSIDATIGRARTGRLKVIRLWKDVPTIWAPVEALGD